MSWSLQVRHGDLTLGGARLGTVTGEAKLVQDLGHHILEHMGTDDMHPAYGSLIDGGRLPTGEEIPGLISESFDRVILEFEREIRRIVSEYQDKQLARAKRDRLVYNKTTLTKGEILIGLSGINFTQDQDTLFANIRLTTGRNSEISLTLPLPGTF